VDVLVAAQQAAKARESAEVRLVQLEARVTALQSALGAGAEADSLDDLVAQSEAELEVCAAEAAVEAALPELEQQAAAALTRRDQRAELILQLEHDRDQEIPARMAAYVAGLREEVRVAEQSVLAQEQHVGALRAARVAGLSGELALALLDGHACPVCGALDHPSPAPVHPDHVTADAVEEQEDSLEAQREQLQKLSTSVAVIVSSVPERAPAVEPARESRAAMLDALQVQIDALAGIGSRIEESNSQLAVAQSTLDDLVSRIETDRARVELSRGAHPSVSDRANVLRARRDSLTELREARALREQARTQLESLTGGESAPAHDAAELAVAQTARDDASAAARRATAESSSAARLLQVVGDLCANVDTAQGEHESVTRNSAATIRLAQALTGSGGQSLSAYVVQRAFDEVVEAANARLAAMLGGHFRLVTTQERTGARRTGLGLGLKVRDLRTDTERRTTTLSGGESFCASLALALGLADSVRAHAGGVEIGMLFIDEGFGALDVERLGDVMAELLRLRADGRTVGVISHVTEMKRAILERVDVLPASSGSTLSVRWMG
jgi:exonuclease SbcC